ncbi:hypothetical protein BGZ89_003042 [Linnemannia elongata]|nr:hypothetical protein BGZ89_003042 [Linnemannia elongata]
MVFCQEMSITHVAQMFKYPCSAAKTSRRQTPNRRSHNRRLEGKHTDWLTDDLDEFAGRAVLLLTTQQNERLQLDPPITQLAVDKDLKKLNTFTLKSMRAESERYNEPEFIEER